MVEGDTSHDDPAGRPGPPDQPGLGARSGFDAHAGHGHDEARCDEALAELYTYLDGELTEAKRISIQHHLDDCSPCLEVYDFEAELRMVIKQRCRDQVPDSLRQRVAERLSLADEEGAAPA